MLRYSGILSIGLLLMLITSPNVVIGKEKTPLHQISAEDCGECHQEIFRQWQDSMHAQSTALKDPVHGAMYRMTIGDPSQEGVKDKASGSYPGCLKCHAPNAARDGKTKLDALPAYAEGVSCVTCHTITAFHGVQSPDGKPMVGVGAYAFSEDHLTGGNGSWNTQQAVVPPGAGQNVPPSVNPFPHTANASLFKSSQVCLGCHERLTNSHGVAVCTIGDLLTRDEGAKPTCQSCHMPVVQGVVSHTLGGGHDLGMLKRGVILEIHAQAGEKGVVAEVSLENTLLHTYPTGAPFRNAMVRVTAIDSAGKEIWRNVKENPMTEDPKSVMTLKLTDNNGHPVMPMMATKVGGDTRLAPGEKRTLTYQIPTPGVKTVRVELFYNLVSKLLVDKIGDKIPDAVKKPVLVSQAEVTL